MGKLQAPTSKPQRNSKNRTPIRAQDRSRALKPVPMDPAAYRGWLGLWTLDSGLWTSYPHPMKNHFALLALLVFAGCGTSAPQVSVARFDATVRPPTKRVEYFEDESQLRGRPFTTIAVLSVPGEGADVQTGAV